MSSEHINVRRKVKEIPSVSSFNDLLERSTLSDEDKELMRLQYLEDKDFRFIEDSLRYS